VESKMQRVISTRRGPWRRQQGTFIEKKALLTNQQQAGEPIRKGRSSGHCIRCPAASLRSTPPPSCISFSLVLSRRHLCFVHRNLISFHCTAP
jgi:hypothetical protein